MPTLADQSRGDSLLLEQVKTGSTEALGALYQRHAETVFRVASRITGSREDAEDVLQDVFLGLPLALERYQERGSFEPWLKRVAVRTALMKVRARGRKREAPLEVLETAPAPGTGHHPVDRITLRRILGEMPDTLRAVFVLKEVEGYSHAEIAGLLGITSGASAMRLLRAWTLLREAVRKQ